MRSDGARALGYRTRDGSRVCYLREGGQDDTWRASRERHASAQTAGDGGPLCIWFLSGRCCLLVGIFGWQVCYVDSMKEKQSVYEQSDNGMAIVCASTSERLTGS